jgi:hypothetical protein
MNELAVVNSIRSDEQRIRYFVVEIHVDDRPICDYSYYATDFHELQRSVAESGDHFIVTCWCGDPGCAGISRGITVDHHQGVVTWQVPAPLAATTFQFDAQAYSATVEDAIAQARSLLQRDPPPPAGTLEVTPEHNRVIFEPNEVSENPRA